MNRVIRDQARLEVIRVERVKIRIQEEVQKWLKQSTIWERIDYDKPVAEQEILVGEAFLKMFTAQI